MKKHKKIISVVLTLSLILSNLASVSAASPNLPDDLILLDEFSTNYYKMASYRNDNNVYVITVMNDGNIELAFAESNCAARSLWMNTQDLYPVMCKSNSIDTEMSLNNNNFVTAVINYGISNQEKGSLVNVTVVDNSESSIQLRGKNTDDYDSLIAQLEDIHGPEYDEKNWTGKTSDKFNGLTFNYKETLIYGMTFRDTFAFTVGTSLGGIVATILAFHPSLSAPIGIIGLVLGVAGLSSAILDHSGTLASYYGSAVYNRYVMVEGGGPYYECYKTTDYNGWVEAGNYNSARLEDLGTRYSATKEIFNSYKMQRDRAYENYT